MNASPANALNLSSLLHPRTRREVWTRLIVALALVIGFMTAYTGMRSARAAFNPVPGTLISGVIAAPPVSQPTGVPTLPRGAVWVPDATPLIGGHWWVGDQLLGLCRLDSPGPVNGGGFTLTNCNNIAKSAGQIVTGPVRDSAGVVDLNSIYMYVADRTTGSVTVARVKITGVNTANPVATGGNSPMKISNITQTGGGLSGGRPSALALYNEVVGGVVTTKQDLLVGYIKSGDVMLAVDVNETSTPGVPVQSKIGSTSDGIGVNSFAAVGNDLYLAEVGGLGGVSKIADPMGRGHVACSVTSVCSAITIGSSTGFPGGMAYDGSRFLYVGDVSKGGSTNFIYRLDLTTTPIAAVVLSNSVAPFSAKDSNQVQTNYTSYTFPLALGYRPNGTSGELYVGGDPQFLAAVVTPNQGHIWKIVTPPPPPTITLLNPNSGAAIGGDVVTITGTNFSTVAGATTVTFGASPAVIATCALATSCTVTTPPGSGTVSVVLATSGGTTGGTTMFTYNAPVGAFVTSISPTFGSANGGDLLTINGSGFTTDGTTSVTFGVGAGGVAGGLAACTNTQCTVTTPPGTGAVDVIVSVGGAAPSTSTPVPADLFNYTPVITGVTPVSGSTAGGAPIVTVAGSGFVPGATAISFGANAGTGVLCASATTCSVVPPAGSGTVDVKVTVGNQTGVLLGGYSYVIPAVVGPQVSSISPTAGSTAGGTVVTLNGVNFPTNGSASVSFNGVAATFVTCTVSTLCTVDAPTAGAGVVSVTLTDPAVVFAPPLPSPASVTSNPASFTYVQATASLYAWGITAPKGGAVWLPGNPLVVGSGHWWSSDHAQGFCRQDLLASGMHALNFSVCGADLVGSAGQGVYDPRPVNTYAIDGTTITGNIPNLHYVYVPDNAVKSVAVWRITFDSNTETMVADPNSPGITLDAAGNAINDQFATPMAPASDLRTLKPNGMALGPLNAVGVFCGVSTAGCSVAQNNAIGLYVTDLVEKYVRVISNPDASPRTQAVDLVAATGDGRGANGTQGFIGNYLYISGNRATQFFDVLQCPKQGFTPPGILPVCGMASVPAPVGVFVSGTAVDPVHKLVYQSNSPGATAATLLRYDASHDVYQQFNAGSLPVDLNGVVHCELLTVVPTNRCSVGPTAGAFVGSGGTLPGPLGSPIVVATGPAGPPAIGAVRPWDLGNHPTLLAKFSFAFGIAVGPSSELIITEDPSAGARSARGSMWTVPFTG